MKWYAAIHEDGSFAQVASVAGHAGRTVELERRGDPHFEILNLATGKWSPNFAVLEAHLSGGISEAAEARKAAALTAGEVKKLEYASKRAEVRAYRSATAAERAAWSNENVAAQLPYAWALADVAKISVADAVGRFESGAEISDSYTARIAAVEDCAKSALRAARNAGDVAAMKAAAVVTWPSDA